MHALGVSSFMVFSLLSHHLDSSAYYTQTPSPYDCTHAAVMKKAATNTIVSADRDFEKVTWIRRIDPANL